MIPANLEIMRATIQDLSLEPASGHNAALERVGLACCGDRLAALWDTAERVEIHSWNPSGWQYEGSGILAGLGLNGRINVLRRLQVRFLVCGAMSGCTRNAVEAGGIHVRPWISGTCPAVLAALAEDRLSTLLMPGCRGRGRCQRAGGKG